MAKVIQDTMGVPGPGGAATATGIITALGYTPLNAAGTYHVLAAAATATQRSVAGNGVSKPLSAYYGTLTAAKVDYPHATALTNQLDWAVITAAIIAANAGGGGNVYAPAGTYLTHTRVTVLSGVYLFGAGKWATTIRIVDPTGQQTVAAIGATGVGVSNLTVDGNQAAYTGPATGGSGIFFSGVVDFSIVGVEVVNSWNNGILIDAACLNGMVSRNLVRETGSDANLSAMIAAGTSGCHGIALSSGCQRITGNDNIVHNSAGSGLNVSDARYCAFVNTICYRDTLQTGGYAAVRVSNGTTYTSVVGVAARNYGRGLFAPVSATSAHNTFDDFTIDGAYYQGALIQADYQTLTNITVKNANQGGAVDGAIRLDSASSCIVATSTLIDDRATKLHSYGIRETGTSNTNRIGPNIIEGYTTGEVLVAGANTKQVSLSDHTHDDRYGRLLSVNTSVPVANTVANTIVETAFESKHAFNAQALAVGDVVRVTARGVMSTAATGPTLAIRLRLGSLILASSGSNPVTANLVDRAWEVQVTVVVHTAGVSGAVDSQGWFKRYSTAGVDAELELKNTATLAVNTTGANDLTLHAQWGTADAANTITLRQLLVEAL